MDSITQILVLAIVGAAIAVFVLIIKSALRHGGKSPRGSSDADFSSGIFGDSGSSDSGGHHQHHGHHHHHDSGGGHHGGFDGGGHHGGFDGGGGHH